MCNNTDNDSCKCIAEILTVINILQQNASCSSVFRVEKIDGCCATFRVLAVNPDAEETNIPYVATNSFFTMNLNCVCCLKCLPDTVVECI